MTGPVEAIEEKSAWALAFVSKGMLPPVDLRAYLPATFDVEQTAALTAVTKWTVYSGVADGTFPVQAIRVGRLIRFRTSDVLAMLDVGASGFEPDGAA